MAKILIKITVSIFMFEFLLFFVIVDVNVVLAFGFTVATCHFDWFSFQLFLVGVDLGNFVLLVVFVATIL